MKPFTQELIEAYNEGRRTQRRELLCHAPSSNMYFNMYGQAAPCWLTLEFAPRYPEHSIRGLWFGESFEGLRARIRATDLTGPCHVCERNIRNRVFTSTLARAYDNDYAAAEYPTIMEFELSNTCNLECIMCKGSLSSTIRRDRDQLPPMSAPYDDAFVDQLEEFIPHLKEARFNGGEPLLQKICWDIWERMRRINPAIEITVATNATTLTARSKRMFEEGRFRVNVSLDSLRKETYESIRVNAVFEKTLENLEWLGEYCRRKGTPFCIMVNPMRNNWQEMPEFVRFCATRKYHLWFNTIWRPLHLALWNLDSATLARIAATLELDLHAFRADPIEGPDFVGALGIFDNFVNGQLKAWTREQQIREQELRDHGHILRTREGSKERFLERLKAGAPRELLTPLLEKVALLESRVTKNVPSLNYYSMLLEQPLEMVIEDLRGKSLEHLTETVYRHDGYY